MDSNDGQPRFELMEDNIKTESSANSPRVFSYEPALSFTKSSSQPLPSTETPDPSFTPSASSGKKGTATVIKKEKRPKGSKPKSAKTPKAGPTAQTGSGPGPDEEAASGEDESDNGPYCICRGPDDHRWMIGCEICEDWFHGECVKINKDIGESLIEKFVCPNCTRGNLVTLYKKTCSLGNCRKPARLGNGNGNGKGDDSVFCSNEHAQMWWERMVGRLPKPTGRAELSDQLAQDEFMAILNSDMAGLNEGGQWRVAKSPFQDDLPKMTNGDGDGEHGIHSEMYSGEERILLEGAASARNQLVEETLLCHKMLTMVELAQERRRAAINAGRFGDDVCGYDQRLDTISSRDAFAAFITSPAGEAILQGSSMGDPLGEDDEARGMCDRKRCKTHQGWQKMLVQDLKHQIREMAEQATEVAEEEKNVKEAAKERWRRKKAENNWVEVLAD